MSFLKAIRLITRETVVSLNTDEFAARGGRRPLMPLADRIAVLTECRLVDQVVVNIGDEDSKIAVVSANVDCIIYGSEWPVESLMTAMGLDQQWLDEVEISLVMVMYAGITNTSEILKAYEYIETVDPDHDPLWSAGTTTCAGCNRAINRTDVDSDGRCSNCTLPVGHDTEEAKPEVKA